VGYYKHGHAQVDPNNPRAFGICDRCGFQYNLHKLQWQYQWAGTMLVNRQFLVCDTCLDTPQPQLRAIILPPDPMPIFNARPEPYAIDFQGPTQTFQATLRLDAETYSTLYLDILDAEGDSILETVTGSATRTNFFSSMGSIVDLMSTNTSALSFTTLAVGSANLVYLALYDAATAGTQLALSDAFPVQTVVEENGLQIPIGGLLVLTEAVPAEGGQWVFNDPVQSGELLTCGIF
jgi:hypothetical protein